jgi:methionine-rich copper-binding protein CopC
MRDIVSPLAGFRSPLGVKPRDLTPPTVTSYSPADNATDVAAEATLSIVFSEKMNTGATTTVTLKNVGGSTIETFDSATDGTWSTTTRLNDTWTVTPASDFASEATLAVQYSGFKDLAGNTITAVSDDTTWNWTVEEIYDPVTALFGSGEKGFLLDKGDPADGYLYEDSAKTTLCTSTSDPVGAWADRSGNGNDLPQTVDNSYRPTVASGGGIQVDGISQYLESAAIDLTGSADLTIIAAVTADTSQTSGQAYIVNMNNLNQGSFRIIWHDANSVFRGSARPDGTSAVDVDSSGPLSLPQTKLITLTIKDSTGAIAIRENGVEQGTGTISGITTGYKNQSITLGCRTGIANFFKGAIHNIVVRGAFTEGTALTDAESYFADLAGISL